MNEGAEVETQPPCTSSNTAPDPADIAITQAAARQHRRRRWLAVLGVVGMLAGYPLSAGPLVAMIDSGFFPSFIEPFFVVYFAPLNRAYNQSEMVKSFYDWYLPLFKVSR